MISFSATTYFLIAVTLVALIMILVDQLRSRQRDLTKIVDSECLSLPDPPGPKPWPVLGSLHILGQYDVPYKAFSELARVYESSIVKLQLGSVSCVVVNGLDNIKEVLYVKGIHFDSRPNFARYHLLFSGNKENSLAFCDWSEMQKTRREMLRGHTFPRAYTTRYNQLNGILGQELQSLTDHLTSLGGARVHAKSPILLTCANVFLHYFCSTRFSFDNRDFVKMVQNFDKVFYEVNQGYAADFMPFLMPLHKRNMARMSQWSHEIREFVTEYVIGERFTGWQTTVEENDYVDCLVNHVRTGAEPKMSWDTGLFAMEDIIGGHSAVGNLLGKVISYLVRMPHVQRMAQKEIDEIDLGDSTFVGLEHRGSMPYTEGILLEAIRVISSPIVPHVANQDSSIAGYKIEKDTFIFLNNYDLNMSADLWTSPEEFLPSRFVQDGKILKPEHFLPFGGGRRSCMGYKMVQFIGFTTIATLLKNFTILPVEKENYTVPIGNLALPEVAFDVRFERR